MLTLLISVLLAGGAVGACVHSSIYTARAKDNHPPVGETVEVDGHRLHVLTAGPDGPPVLMIHGASANAREFTLNLMPQLSDRFRVLAPDRPGHGYSERPETEGAILAMQARQLAGLLDVSETGPVIVVGHSYGGAVALRLALDHPDKVRGLVLLAPVTHDWGDNGGTAWYNDIAAPPIVGHAFAQLAPLAGPGAARSGMASVFHPAPVPENYYDEAAIGLLFRPAAFRANARDMVALRRELAAQETRYEELDMPVIVFSGAKDTVLKPQLHARRLEKQATNVELVKLPDGGHMPHHEHAAQIADAVAQLASARN
ncbi:MAG: alpha/beta fold hydrolase [Alphaproteobacteria bacterium]|jgi:pimeloyl-ACP methyl ester carboxylesterase|nr:alpha/beta fold hydrolase [Alphaproteobacteria bacterium]